MPQNISLKLIKSCFNSIEDKAVEGKLRDFCKKKKREILGESFPAVNSVQTE